MRVEWTGNAFDLLADVYVTAAPADRDVIATEVERINATPTTTPGNSANLDRDPCAFGSLGCSLSRSGSKPTMTLWS